jgi:hypothetical protein
MGDVNISGTTIGSGAKPPQQVCGAIVNGNLTVQSDSNAITVGGTNCGATAVGGNLQVRSGSGAVSITCTSITGTLTVQGNARTVLLSGNTVRGNLQVQNKTDAAANATQVLNNKGHLIWSAAAIPELPVKGTRRNRSRMLGTAGVSRKLPASSPFVMPVTRCRTDRPQATLVVPFLFEGAFGWMTRYPSLELRSTIDVRSRRAATDGTEVFKKTGTAHSQNCVAAA